ncbi:transporter substrate-binding domain-containing protein [Peptostreptococcus sp.]|jgi:ABC transporter, substrate-binding protein, family 3|uniref:transporter substrate-binding domain-containing protein n=1 Tax=Peptostreptococcus sp. TaxID=1262 RepID=UPI001CAB352F|nr:transporter substrate-binding domain-containing protein [Peptostreptococcus sp.]MBF1050335.1 transporter substrate-binding domain-containing protein [Peptostreptococcus sp.]MBF1058845.1 transporter substrate-binding domain-containing protein [Peptostreptococcus sp.]
MKAGLKKLVALGLVAVLAVGLVGCGNKSSDNSGGNQTALEQIKKNKKLVVATSPDYPPFEFMVSENGKSKIVGADIDLAQKIADKLGVELELKAMDFDALVPALQAGKVDMVITGMTPNEKRKKAVDFSDIYFKGENAVIVNAKDAGKFTSEDQLKKAKLGVQKGSTQETYVKDNLKVTNYKALVAVPDLIADMKNGNIDAVVLNSKVAGINVTKYDGIKVVENLKLTSGGDEEAMAVAIKKGDNADLIKLTNEVIKGLQDSGEYDKILANAVDLVSKETK